MNRRDAVKWMLAATATMALREHSAFGSDAVPPPRPAAGYGNDPDMLRDYKPGDLWPLTFNEQQRRTAESLCDLILPADGHSPSAGALGVHEFIDEWVSAPYPGHPQDRAIILAGLAWLDAESQRRFSSEFASLVQAQKTAICDEICYAPLATPARAEAAAFFAKFRNLTAGGFYTTPRGSKDIGYVGNVPLPVFDGPPPEALAKLGIVKTSLLIDHLFLDRS